MNQKRIVACLAGLLTVMVTVSASVSSRPNILWIYAEDQSPLMSCYGVQNNPTPVIDQLATDGVMFSQAFMPAPVCSATRSALITGAMPTTFGLHNHRSSRTPDSMIALPVGVKTVPEIFKEAGYFTFNVGKDDYNFQYDRKNLYDGGSSGGFANGLKGQKVDWKARKGDQPFFGQIQIQGGKSKAKIAPINRALVTIPPYYPDHPEIRKIWARHHDTARIMDRETGSIIKRLKADGLLENTIVFVFSDHGWNNGLRDKQFCYDGGLHVPLVITWYGNPDAIQAGKPRTDMVNGIDIPVTSLALAGLPIPDYMEGLNLFAPEYKRDYIIGVRDRCDFTIDRIRTVRTEDFRYVRNFMTDRPYMQSQYRDGRPYTKLLKQLYADGAMNEQQAWFFADTRPAEELYDLQTDPHQTINVAARPEYADALKAHRTILKDWIEATDDQGQYPESIAGLTATKARWKDKCVNPEYRAIP
ncbi:MULTISPECIES: sulfatase [unclassified Lentimonas]|uniref:sulfatase family protein n=1 Tax=unclassified Lentimonas TaxID=2630993 RepID=UPI0013289CE1|nr:MULTISPECIES: sulfatase [unclassified Lentimonas]CAA6677605.1 Choline-sulfatase (EC [Lentimonas sp. CC4]CAA6684297.1 Choline-sulfatase (EC [Lentimonas sp. CC6]CAA7078186.1 Choline-sulfatase (EC [Lentimonas sp. CC4]CAA7168298.1 Choline-sulfatase (EC [Lentimonas sp. CC21]CAA7181869.1 Choline-sulfatase (EC [Lentimonas sp. CC8]